MKKLFFICACAACMAGSYGQNEQVVLESKKVIEKIGSLVRMEPPLVKEAMLVAGPDNYIMDIYNTDWDKLKTIRLDENYINLRQDDMSYDYSISQTFFNDDDLFEYVTIKDYKVNIVNENDEVLCSAELSNKDGDPIESSHYYSISKDKKYIVIGSWLDEGYSVKEIFEVITLPGSKQPLLSSKDHTLYPNPATSSVCIESDGEGQCRIDLYTTAGQPVAGQSLSAGTNNVDISALTPGAYLYAIRNNRHITKSGKLIVE